MPVPGVEILIRAGSIQPILDIEACFFDLGYGQSGKSDRPFSGKGLRAEFQRQVMPKVFYS